MRTKPSTTPVSVTRAWRFGHWTRCSSAQTAMRNCMTRGRSLCASASTPRRPRTSYPSSPAPRGAPALLGQTLGPALCLPLLGPLTVTCHAYTGARRSAGLLVRRMPATPAAVLAELDPVGIVPLRLLGLVVAPLALLAREGDGDSDVSASHGSFGR